MLQETTLNQSEIASHSELPPGSIEDGSSEETVELVTILTLLLREKKIILSFIAGAAILAAIVVYLIMKPVYTGEAVFLPPQGPPGSSAMSQMASQLGALGGMGGVLPGLKSPGDVYLGILGSRTIADGLIKQFDLQKVYKTKKLSAAEKTLENNSSFVAAKNTLVTIKVKDHDPKRAADLANAYLDSLREQNGKLALTEAAQRRLFFEQQLEREKNALADAEVDMKRTQEQTGLIIPNGQAQVEIESMSQMRAQIASRQVELAAMREGATDQNPQVIRLQTQIAGLEQELQKLQSDPSRRQPGNIQLPTSKVPELALEYIRKQREVKYHEVLFELIAKQYEAARLDESKDAPVLQVIDRAVVPDQKSGPARTLTVLIGGFVGGFIGIIWVIMRNFVVTLKQDPAKATKLDELRQAASFGR
jgi:tyrosine-protein kinase Etk/Wzc